MVFSSLVSPLISTSHRMPRIVDEIPAQLQGKVEENENEILDLLSTLDGINLEDVTLEQMLELSKEDLVKRYARLDIATRRSLRVNEQLAEVEMECNYQYGTLDIRVEESAVLVSCNHAVMDIPHAEVEKEFQLLGKNTHFNKVNYKSRSDDREAIKAIGFLKAKKISIDDPSLDDSELQSAVQNKEEVSVCESNVTDYNWIYEKMRDRQLDVTFIRIESFNVDDRYNFMTGLGHFDKDENKFYATNPKQEVADDDDLVTITEGRLQIVCCGYKENEDGYDSGPEGPYSDHGIYGFVSFEIFDEVDGASK
ncbi:hypothetical protein PRIPAC_85172 [Pristionchus pacificus]|uniref:Uncharacterized protein n=1 Tax=Pristionchus pacificus TaxID=54126 RepID=A0A2A6CEJ4_PRIPA|nr:hypothetical protein PRIPAC_85172 [Pristionchus pacificus]|eukprot:PDM76508.1 hypothetical protein PRIPAC_42874 [Pristionchus pacificus]